jgi:hypothetical protein
VPYGQYRASVPVQGGISPFYLEQFFTFIPTQLFKKFYLILEVYRLAAMLIRATLVLILSQPATPSLPIFMLIYFRKKYASFVKVIFS